MNRDPHKRQEKDLLEKAEKIGDLLKLEKIPTHRLAWKEPRLGLAGGGECYPIIDIFERIANIVTTPQVAPKPPKKRGPKKKVEGTNEV